MIKGPLPDKLQYALLEIVANAPEHRCQYSWGGWGREVGRLVPDYTPIELAAAFKVLWKGGKGMLDLSKPDAMRRDAVYYSGNKADDEAFFYRGDLNASLTAEGETYWGRIRIEKKKAAIGFPHG